MTDTRLSLQKAKKSVDHFIFLFLVFVEVDVVLA